MNFSSRDNVTMFSGHKVVGYDGIIILYIHCGYFNKTRHRENLKKISSPSSSTVLRYRVVVVAKLIKCRVPSSV